MEKGFARKLAVSRMVFAEISLLLPARAFDKADKALILEVKRLAKVLASHSSLAELFFS